MKTKNSESFSVVTEDGVQLKGELLYPEGTAKAIVQINAATGSKRGYYIPFAQFLTEHGFIVCLWDYRGMGESAPSSLKDVDYKFSDVGLKDIPAILDFLNSKFSLIPILGVGHSVGGQQLGLIKNNHLMKGFIAVATSAGFPGYMPLGYRLKTLYFFYVVSPLSIKLKGYVAAKKLGIMEDLPRNVLLEWRDWCSKPDYLFDSTFYGKTIPVGNYQRLTFPVKVITATDDPIANPRSVKRFWSHVISNQGIFFKSYSPAELRVSKIDHFGFFRKTFKDSIWKEMLESLENFI